MERTIVGIQKSAPHFMRQLRRKFNRLQAVAEYGWTAIDRLKSVVCNTIVNLLENWCALVLYCGFLVRQCNWPRRQPGPTIDAHHVLQPLYNAVQCSQYKGGNTTQIPGFSNARPRNQPLKTCQITQLLLQAHFIKAETLTGTKGSRA